VGTVVPNPLADVPGAEKTLVVIQSDKAWGSSKHGATRLLAIVHSEPGRPVSSIDAAYPRAELTITRLPKGD
jgi:hypothetical protein